eukprot:2718588-Amphidinium_carterae.4
MMLALRGTPWDSKGRLATTVPTMGGLPPPTAAASTAKSSNVEETLGVAPDAGGAEGSTDHKMAETPEDLPEEGEQASKVRNSDQKSEHVVDLGRVHALGYHTNLVGQEVTRPQLVELVAARTSTTARDSTVRMAEPLDEADQEAHNF